MIQRLRLHVQGMVCPSCAARVEKALRAVDGVRQARVSLAASRAVVDIDSDLIDAARLKEAIASAGYSSPDTGGGGLAVTISAVVLIVAASALASRFGLFGFLPRISASASSAMLVVAGLLTSLHCIAMCGGINVSQALTAGSAAPWASSAGQARDPRQRMSWLLPAVLYNAGRLVSYTAIGAAAGALGSAASFSPQARAALMLAAGLLMVVVGLRLLGFLRFPDGARLPVAEVWSAVAGKLRGRGPFVVGLLNGLMPCGPLQTMQLYALGTGSILAGASSMFLFCLGTIPLAFGVGAGSRLLARRFAAPVMRVGAALVMVFAVVMIVRAMSVYGLSVGGAGSGRAAAVSDGVQTFRMELRPDRYESFAVRAAVPLRWTIATTAETLTGCNETVTVPAYGIRRTLVPGDNLIEFTPAAGSPITYTCWMGMITARITVLSAAAGFLADAFGPARAAPQPEAGPAAGSPDDCKAAVLRGGIQEAFIRVTDKGYVPAVIVLQRGVKARISFTLESRAGCDSVVSIPEQRRSLRLAPGRSGTLLLDATRDVTFLCGIGVLHGTALVVSDLARADLAKIRRDMFSRHAFARPRAGGAASCCN